MAGGEKEKRMEEELNVQHSIPTSRDRIKRTEETKIRKIQRIFNHGFHGFHGLRKGRRTN